jgi:hypothetical protein
VRPVRSSPDNDEHDKHVSDFERTPSWGRRWFGGFAVMMATVVGLLVDHAPLAVAVSVGCVALHTFIWPELFTSGVTCFFSKGKRQRGMNGRA